jgi:hypothetical protein
MNLRELEGQPILSGSLFCFFFSTSEAFGPLLISFLLYNSFFFFRFKELAYDN